MMNRRLRRHRQLMATLDRTTQSDQWGPSDDAVQAGRREFAGRATAGPAQGIDVLVTVWTTRRRPWRPFKTAWTPGESIPQDAYGFCIDLFTHDTEADARYEAAGGEWTYLGLSLPEVLEWAAPYAIQWLSPAHCFDAGYNWGNGTYQPYVT